MSLAPWVVSDARWKRIESLLPNVERRFRFPGRKRVPDRRALQGILFVLYTGIAWATSAARARFRFRLDLLPADGRVAAGGSVAQREGAINGDPTPAASRRCATRRRPSNHHQHARRTHNRQELPTRPIRTRPRTQINDLIHDLLDREPPGERTRESERLSFGRMSSDRGHGDVNVSDEDALDDV